MSPPLANESAPLSSHLRIAYDECRKDLEEGGENVLNDIEHTAAATMAPSDPPDVWDEPSHDVSGVKYNRPLHKCPKDVEEGRENDLIKHTAADSDPRRDRLSLPSLAQIGEDGLPFMDESAIAIVSDKEDHHSVTKDAKKGLEGE
jgi:hypothetical protein